MKLKALVMTAITLALGATLLAQDQARERKLQQAIDLLETKGDAAGAMPLLEDVAKSTDQALAARGLLYLGQAQERQGNARARATYERIVRDFASQHPIVAQARSRLAGLARGGGSTPGSISSRLLSTLPAGVWLMGNVSPDGRYIPYERAGALIVQSLIDGTNHTISAPVKGDWPEDAIFSRDSKQVAYTWYNKAAERYELRVSDAFGAETPPSRTLLSDADLDWVKPHDWTPDGKHIVLEIQRKDRVSEISVLSVHDRSRRTLKAGKWGIRAIVFSPDGQLLAFDHREADAAARNIYVVSIDGTREIPAVVHRADDSLVGWSPDGNRILFLSDRGGVTSLWAQSVEKGVSRGSPSLVKANFGEASSVSIGARGIVYSVTNPLGPSNADIKAGKLDFSTGLWTSPPEDVVREYSAASNQFPEWSPDGRSLAYVTRRTSMRGDDGIALRAFPGGSVREIRPGLTFINRLHWTPDGRALLANGSGYSGRRAWWRVDAATGEMEMFEPTQPSGNTLIAGWSKDGSTVYLNRPVSETEVVLFARNMATKQEREVFRGVRGPDPTQAQISRDGMKIYYRKFLPDGSKPPFAKVAFVERDIASGAEREVARGQFGGIVVSPDGQYIATGSNDQGTDSRLILLISIAAGTSRELFRVPLPAGFAAGPATLNPLRVELWAPDSGSVLTVKSFGPGKPAELWWVPIDGRARPKQLDSDYKAASSIRVHPDGRQVVFQLSQPLIRQPQEVWILENAVK